MNKVIILLFIVLFIGCSKKELSDEEIDTFYLVINNQIEGTNPSIIIEGEYGNIIPDVRNLKMDDAFFDFPEGKYLFSISDVNNEKILFTKNINPEENLDLIFFSNETGYFYTSLWECPLISRESILEIKKTTFKGVVQKSCKNIFRYEE